MKQGTVKYSGSRLSFAPLSVPSTFSTAVDPFRLPLTVVVWLVMCSVMIPRVRTKGEKEHDLRLTVTFNFGFCGL
ncbi:unnamed protein product [Brassica rapa]|uniref:Uncharacterized protein n=2 Tax=Brassica TaxID=3705 RepID=A0A8D9DA33_BRACM|nr:unnamed protein product [Brassica napus]CAG7872111.1 unnamed protein product [Brassica rapa]